MPIVATLTGPLTSPGFLQVLALTLLAALAIGALATAVLPRLTHRLLRPPRPPRVRDYLPFERVHDDNATILCRGNRAVRVWQLTGINHAALPRTERLEHNRARQRVLCSLENLPVQLRIFAIRSLAQAAPPAPIDTALPRTLREISTAWNRHVRRNIYTNHHYWVGYADANATGFAALDHLDRTLRSRLTPYAPMLLSFTDAPAPTDPDDARTQCPLAPWRALFSPASPPTPLAAGPPPDAAPSRRSDSLHLADIVATDELWIGRQGRFVFRSGPRERHMQTLAIRWLGRKPNEGLVEDILRIDSQLVVVHAVRPISRMTATASLAFEARAAPLNQPGGHAASATMTSTIDVLTDSDPDSEHAELVHYTLTLHVFGDTPAATDATVERIEDLLATAGFTAVRGGLAAEADFWAHLPSWETLSRPWRILTFAAATLALPQTAPTGVRRHCWAPRPLTTFLTADHSPFGFSFHPNERRHTAGHCAVIGQTGTGKTTFLCHLVSQMLTIPDARVRIFDRFNSAEVFTRSAGGNYIAVMPDDHIDGTAGPPPLSLNPFLQPDTRSTRIFLASFLRQLIGRTDPDDDPVIARAITTAFEHLPPGMRNLTHLYATIPPRSHAHTALRQWIDPQFFGDLFNATTDDPASHSGRLIGYDVTAALANPDVAPPLMSYLMHRTRTEAPGKPTLFYIDETAPMLESPEFVSYLKAGLQEGRRMRHVYALCFQHPESIQDTGCADVINTQCSTRIFLRNPGATPDTYTGYDLNELELNFILGRSHEDLDWAVLVKRTSGPHSAILNVDVSCLGPWAGVYASGLDDVREFRAQLATHALDRALDNFLGLPATVT